MQRRRKPAHGRANSAQRRLVRGRGRFEYGRVRLDQRNRAPIWVAAGDGSDFDCRFFRAPAVALLQEKINDTKMAAPEPGHDGWLAVDPSAFCVDVWQAGKIVAGKQQVLMPEEQCVEAVELREVLARVLLPPG